MPEIDAALVERLIASQFPKWKDLQVQPVLLSGSDNRTFHLGSEMLVRMPSSQEYSSQVEKEQYFLPKLAPFLPLPIPTPIDLGEPMHGYPWKWSIYRWIDGEPVSLGFIEDLSEFAKSLALFLKALQSVDSTGGPLAGPQSFHRGGSLAIYDEEVQRALSYLPAKIDTVSAQNIWKTALSSSWKHSPVWVHGDVSAGNLLVNHGRLFAVLDFGQLSVGDPACDLAINWTLFQGESRDVFQRSFDFDAATWNRALGWVLWKALIAVTGFSNPSNFESKKAWTILEDIL
jgi:aminoglycoside phosphotransferase (APT) family kinase protein